MFRIGRHPAGGLHPLDDMTQRLQKLRLDSWTTQVRLAQTEAGGSWRLWNAVTPEQSSSNPFGHLAHLLEDLQVPKFGENDRAYATWWSRFHHLTLIRLAVANVFFNDPSDENKLFVGCSRDAVNRFIESTPKEIMNAVERHLRAGRVSGST